MVLGKAMSNAKLSLAFIAADRGEEDFLAVASCAGRSGLGLDFSCHNRALLL